MKFVSTRGGDERVGGAEAIVKGLAGNGGLFVPESFPQVSQKELEGMLTMSYAERAADIISRYLDEYDRGALLRECERVYSKFEGGDPAPLVRIRRGLYVLELFHGPTLAFKDMALTLLPYLLKEGCRLCGIREDVLILVATSGDTGKAAMEGFRDAEGVKICVFYPADGVSKMQKLQMTTQEGNNVYVAGVRGNFDDCQTAVKKIFADREYAGELRKKGVVLSSANSINFGRLCPQIAYYFSAYLDMVSSGQIELGDGIDFCVPTGNFGNILAGYYAKRMGLPVRRLHCASNSNNVLTDFFAKGVYDARRELLRTTSPSMDILVSSNLERLIFEVSGRDGDATRGRMEELSATGTYSVTDAERSAMAGFIDAGYSGESDCVEAMYDLYCDTGYVIDPHTGCAMKVITEWKEKNKKDTTPCVVVSTANPYKFPQDVFYAVTGNDVKDCFKGMKRLFAATGMPVPDCLADLKDRTPVFTDVIRADRIYASVTDFVDGRIGPGVGQEGQKTET